MPHSSVSIGSLVALVGAWDSNRTVRWREAFGEAWQLQSAISDSGLRV